MTTATRQRQKGGWVGRRTGSGRRRSPMRTCLQAVALAAVLGGCGIRIDPDGVAQVFMTVDGIEFLVNVGGEGTEVQLHFHGFPGVSQHWVPPEELYSADFAAETGVYVFKVPAECEMRVTQTAFAGKVRPEGVSVAGRIDRDGEPMYFSTLMTVAELDAAPALCARVRRALRRGP
ncbi:MAG: hypothetical protein ACXIUZ_05900 [Lysobacteraceae bacterium]